MLKTWLFSIPGKCVWNILGCSFWNNNVCSNVTSIERYPCCRDPVCCSKLQEHNLSCKDSKLYRTCNIVLQKSPCCHKACRCIIKASTGNNIMCNVIAQKTPRCRKMWNKLQRNPCWKNKRNCILLTILLFLGLLFITFSCTLYGSLFTTEIYVYGTEAPARCLEGRFEAGEDVMMDDILRWMDSWIHIPPHISANHKLLPCHNNSGEVCQPTDCRHPLSLDVRTRIQREMFDPDMMLTMKYIIRMQCFGDQVPESDIIVVTAASSNQNMTELMSLVNHVKKDVLPEIRRELNSSLLVVDMGLKPGQRSLLQMKCNCKIINFPYWSFPDHVKLENNCSAWKPIVIRAFLTRVRHSLIYMAPDVRLKAGYIWKLLDKAKQSGVLFPQPLPIALPTHTLKETFDFFKVDHCAFYHFPEVQSNFAIFRNVTHVNRILVEPWTSCALNQECVCPMYPTNKITPCPLSLPLTNAVGQCHKFEQSILNILLAKIFNRNIHQVTLGPDQPYVNQITTDESEMVISTDLSKKPQVPITSLLITGFKRLRRHKKDKKRKPR